MFDAEAWKAIARKAEMESTRFHDLPHFFAAYVRDQMGIPASS
jgi:hypothetical protein